MSIRSEIEAEIDLASVLEWSTSTTEVVPDAEDIPLSDGGRYLDATMLYADLAASTQLAMSLPPEVCARIAKSFLVAACRVIRFHGGRIRSFDGDRVMGVFVGDSMCTKAARVGLELHYYVDHYIRPRFMGLYPEIAASGLEISHGVGVDVGRVFVVRSGIRRNNDLVWVGRAPNIAAKLAAIRVPDYRTFITGDVLEKLNASVHKAPANHHRFPGRIMWDWHEWEDAPDGYVGRVAASPWWSRRARNED